MKLKCTALDISKSSSQVTLNIETIAAYQNWPVNNLTCVLNFAVENVDRMPLWQRLSIICFQPRLVGNIMMTQTRLPPKNAVPCTTSFMTRTTTTCKPHCSMQAWQFGCMKTTTHILPWCLWSQWRPSSRTWSASTRCECKCIKCLSAQCMCAVYST